jgi:signal peptidase I
MPDGWYLLAEAFLLLLLLTIAFIRATLLVIVVEGTSMSPTFEPGERVLALRYWPRRWLRRGQIAIVAPFLNRPADFEQDLYIKRIAGLPGDTLVTTLDELEEALRPAFAAFHDADGRRAWPIPPGHCFVRGDHPLSAVDSRAWGPLPFAALRGVVIKRLARPAPTGQQP